MGDKEDVANEDAAENIGNDDVADEEDATGENVADDDVASEEDAGDDMADE